MHARSGWLKTLKTCWVWPATIGWKLGLIAACALPPPANDAFFFDGAVVNWLRHGAYVNPSIGRVFPTSGAELFSAYPPFYQAVLWAWMSVFGPTAQSALWLHGVLFAAFALTALAVLRRLAVPVAAINLGGLFLFGLTFHDRPDSVAQLAGLLSLLAWLRAAEGGPAPGRWRVLGATALVLCLLTNLHVGALYLAVGLAHAALAPRRPGASAPWLALAAAVAVPLMLAAATARWWPVAWTGLMENLDATPSITGWRLPRLDEVLKIGRTVPGVLLVAAAAALWWRDRLPGSAGNSASRPSALWLALLGPAVLATVLALVFFTANFVQDVAYLQPLIAALALAVWPAAEALTRGLRRVLFAGAALASIRAVGLSTWGVACALDVSCAGAEARAHHAIAVLPPNAEALVSSAYLYALADQTAVRCYHSDWAGRFGEGDGALRPGVLVLTAYDYYRRYKRELAELAARGSVKIVSVEHDGRVPPPDAFPRLQRVLQHVSWAPVIVRLEWR